MASNEEENGCAFTGVDVQAVHAAFGDFQAGYDVIASGNTLGGVMQQQSQVKQLGRFQFLEQFGVAPVPLGLRLLQPVQALDGQEGMLVDREAMVRVWHNQRIEA